MKRKLRIIIYIFILLGLISTNITDLKVYVHPIVNNIQYKWIAYRTNDFKRIETEHFIIRYNTKDKKMPELVGETIEEKYEDVCANFKYEPKDKTMVIIYNDGKELMKNSNIGQGKPPMGVYLGEIVQVLSPGEWIDDQENISAVFKSDGPMVHEFTHRLVDDLAKGNYPIWFTEGIALYEEYIQNGYEWGKGLSYEDEPYTVEALTKSFDDLDQTLAYKRSFELVKVFVDEYGFNPLNDILVKLGEGKSFDDAHKEVLGVGVDEIY
ncbi:hypothetical protein IZY60_02105 [Lutibacter sp. B2]|nr:hypothetical protein [Lutibacter sp. B2]